ncbi:MULTISPECIES: nuclear transport factor 2 family protein [unclassified Tenacibaculum]|uniref:nuclear transport factor 2 family protein n=1 Tax=unclassified Tenacibaculum TaxID=2635139 RepID=UPI001F1FD251|nr:MULTISPECIES: nuclear transport factor 2 family protein [unclassified Tenacibaculum]MCF2874509.1 nuclear transport factor 2 family protein [Tenacibaculum sp. Cn5-1]MCF2934425.1 nuclear transport factor 2 family protein [Tenacibaculum sp. Cn5-34]MCG7510635.1 nuclear transport factor 2 family protein [Tenacibaculum sp. Cn5-46]
MKQICIVLLSAIVLVSCDTPRKKITTKPITKKETKMENLKGIAQKAQEAFFKDYSVDGVKKYFAKNYIQHNPHVPTGIEPVLGFLPVLKEGKTTYTTHRILQDGDFIVFHNSYHNAEPFGGKEVVAFDVWRMENGKVAEHWDNITVKVDNTASGRSQVDGETAITDIDKTKENKEIVTNFVNDVLFGKAPQKITEYVSSEEYLQHNPMVKDDLTGLNEAIEYLTSQNNMFKYQKLHKVLGEGNFILTMSEGEWNGKSQAFYDLFRLKDGKIVEHWDVIQEIPSEMAHKNGKF